MPTASAFPGFERAGRSLTGRRTERGVLDQLVDDIRQGTSRVLVLRGEPGVGKTSLLDYAGHAARGFRIETATGVQAEMELPFAGLHQLVAPLLDGVESLPDPQRNALRTAFGLSDGDAPDRFLVGLATLGLLSDAAEDQPLLCIVDDLQWLDRASVQAMAFVGRRLQADAVGMVFGARIHVEELMTLPELLVEGLPDADAYALLDSVLTAPLDARVRDRVIAEARGNPLALLELFRGSSPAELAGGFGLPTEVPVASNIEDEFGARLDALPTETQRLLQLAAADPVGDPVLVWRAAEHLGIAPGVEVPALEAGLLEIGTSVRFRHPLVRSAAYRSASDDQRRAAHRALAQATDPVGDPDRRAWHRAQGTSAPDDDVAAELEQCAGRAQGRGGLAAAAAFLQRAAAFTSDPGERAERGLAAAAAMRDAGGHDAALGLLVSVEAGPSDLRRSADVERLRGQIAGDQLRYGDAARLLLSAAMKLETLDVKLSRETYLLAIGAAQYATHSEWPNAAREVATAAHRAPPVPRPGPVDAALDVVATRLMRGHRAAAPLLRRAVDLALAPDVADDASLRWLWLTTGWASAIIAIEAWDDEAWLALASMSARLARDAGAPPHLMRALDFLAWTLLIVGSPVAAQEALEEMRIVGDAIGQAAQPTPGSSELTFALWRGEEESAPRLLEARLGEVAELGMTRAESDVSSIGARLYNSLGRHDRARDLALQAFSSDEIGLGPWLVGELAEAAARTGTRSLLEMTRAWMSERIAVTPTEWALGIDARIHAFLADGDVADQHYRTSIDHLGRTRVRVELARAHLLYGEWLRREKRRVDGREELEHAHELFTSLGATSFADRAARELLATGATVRKRSVDTATDLTAQETQVARLARDGLSNPEIGARLFISPRTVQYHLRKVFQKLGISSRGQLHRVLTD